MDFPSWHCVAVSRKCAGRSGRGGPFHSLGVTFHPQNPFTMRTYTEEEVEQLLEHIRRLEGEVEFLRAHPALAQGLKGERLICALTGSIATQLNTSFDLTSKVGLKVEVKLSKLHTPVKASPNTKRWTWTKPMGWLDKGKDYDYLILLGEKDTRYRNQYLDDAPYVAFIVPLKDVPAICSAGRMIGANVNLTTNLKTVNSEAGRALLSHMTSMTVIDELLSTARPECDTTSA